MYKYTFKNGDILISKLNKEELLKRMNRLDTLRVLTEGYDNGVGFDIYKKVLRAYNKMKNFNGIIRLTMTEKDFLGYMLENPFNSQNDIEVLKYYIK